MELNWTVVTYVVIGFFALNGLFRGWWKEAVTTGFLAVLVFLLQLPGVADGFVAFLNNIIRMIWDLLPPAFVSILRNILEDGLGISTVGGVLQANPGSASTWLIVLLVFLGLATLIGRAGLPRDNRPTPIGGLIGALVGGFNGFLIINLIREYLDGRSLPGSTAPPAEITLAGSSPTVRAASSGVSIQAVELPRFTILDSFIPWIIIIVGLFILIAVINTRFSRDGANIRRDKTPFGYR